MTIYVDVLFVVNFFITYLLLLLTKLLIKSNSNSGRLLLSSFLGGLYSLVILVDRLSLLLSLFGKLLVSVLLVFVAFGFRRLLLFIKAIALFYFSNMLFLGVILAIQLVFNSTGAAVSNGVVYFDISAGVLLASAFAAYLIAALIIKLYNRTLAAKEIYCVSVEKNGQHTNLYAFLDSGNRLREPFSDYPVIIVDSRKITAETERIIPYNTVGGEGMLRAFRPDRIIISNGKNKIETDKVYIALSDIDEKDYSAILNPQLMNM